RRARADGAAQAREEGLRRGRQASPQRAGDRREAREVAPAGQPIPVPRCIGPDRMKRILLIAVALAACVDRGAGPQGKKIEPGYARENLLTAAPQGLQALNVDLGGKVVYLGNTIEPAMALAPGGTVKVTHYWQVKQPPGEQWRVFSF